jgi:High-affinity nickel-transport protein
LEPRRDGWAFVKPIRKLYYNLTITAVPVIVAVVVGGLEVLNLIGDLLGLTDGAASGARSARSMTISASSGISSSEFSCSVGSSHSSSIEPRDMMRSKQRPDSEWALATIPVPQ